MQIFSFKFAFDLHFGWLTGEELAWAFIQIWACSKSTEVNASWPIANETQVQILLLICIDVHLRLTKT